MTTLENPQLNQPSSIYVPEPAEIIKMAKLTEMEMHYELRLADGRPLGQDPGQFVQVSLLGVGECPISLCSSPTRPETFELCIRRVGKVTECLHRLSEGDTIGIRGPLGHGFDVNEMHGKDILIVAGGLGIAPARSLIQYILDERERFGRFFLLYGGRTPQELLFKDDVVRWRENPDVDFHVTVDQPDSGWRGKSGVVTTLFRELPKLDPNETLAVIIGPPIMFKFVVLEILSRRIPQTSIYCSLERQMKCGVGKCGHCQVNNIYVCQEGPVFKYAQLKALRESVE
ncbi:MAG: FAD/NAD(P)-binding protein [Phycisphaerae bacterium]|nr:FAD/NAD(P)-binding protein [Phycisphaerae bacterium]